MILLSALIGVILGAYLRERMLMKEIQEASKQKTPMRIGKVDYWVRIDTAEEYL